MNVVSRAAGDWVDPRFEKIVQNIDETVEFLNTELQDSI